MWISKKRYNKLEERVADLEKSQLHANTMVKEYIENQESMSKELCERINELPDTIKTSLQNYCFDKR